MHFSCSNILLNWTYAFYLDLQRNYTHLASPVGDDYCLTITFANRVSQAKLAGPLMVFRSVFFFLNDFFKKLDDIKNASKLTKYAN